MNQSITVQRPQPAAKHLEPRAEHVRLSSDDSHQIPVYLWQQGIDPGSARGVIHISHGMAEHGLRYQVLAENLNAAGYIVVAHDHRGHGQQTKTSERGHYADTNGWKKVTGDLGFVQHWIAEQFPQLRCYLLGHSMGSFIAQGYLIGDGQKPTIGGLILSGSNRDQKLKLAALRSVAASARGWNGPRKTSRVIQALTFGAFSKTVTAAKTRFDWLNQDEASVAEYINDPLCGFDCTNQLWCDLGYGLNLLQDKQALTRVPSNLPILIISGDKDPVGEFGRGPRRLAHAYRDTGHTDVSCVVMPGMRHEPFNEARREDTINTLLNWLERHAA
ncbi:alpha/beta fold hydrolase [Marinobacter sp. 1Y8]